MNLLKETREQINMDFFNGKKSFMSLLLLLFPVLIILVVVIALIVITQ